MSKNIRRCSENETKMRDIGFSRFGSGTYCLKEIHPMKKILLFILALCLWHHGR